MSRQQAEHVTSLKPVRVKDKFPKVYEVFNSRKEEE